MEVLKRNAFVVLFGGFLLVWPACSPGKREAREEGGDISDQPETPYKPDPTVDLGPQARADLGEASGSGVRGAASFLATGDKTVKMEVDVGGLPPGPHALHLHEKGDCSAPDAKSAGSHWNPTKARHGMRGTGQYHKGDIANLQVDEDGKIVWSEEIVGWTIGGPDSTNILNKAVIIHARADDFTSQPSGDAGDRIACGVIMLKEEE